MQLAKLFPFVFLLFCFTARAAKDPATIAAELKAVTIYRSGAEMTHLASLQLASGNQELIIGGISNAVDINSVQINCPQAVTILSVEFGNNYLVAPEATARIRYLTDSADKVRMSLEKVGVEILTTIDLLEVLKSNGDLKGSQTGVKVAELMKLMEYYKGKSSGLQNELAALKERQKKGTELLTKINSQVKEEENKNTKESGQLHLQLLVAVTGKYDFEISYITPHAWWTPAYDIRVDDIKSPLKIIYKAKMVQTTGIDWKKVKLSLSTSVPNQWGNAPVLRSWFLAYVNPINVMDKSLAGRANGIQGFNQSPVLNEVVITGYAPKIRGNNSVSGAGNPVYIVNGAIISPEEFSRISPSSVKTTEVLKEDAATAMYGARAAAGAIIITLKDGLEDYVSVSDNELNVLFDIDLPYDVPATGKVQTAVLKEYSAAANYKYYSVPRLDKDAYLLAEVADWERLNLLPGDANIIFEGTYAGKSFIDPNSTLDTLNLTLGRDKRVVIKKEKLADYSSVKFLGSNKLQKITYEITVKNNKKDSIKMMLKDQYPLSTLKEIEVELTESGAAAVNPDTGVLTWKLELAPGESKKIKFAYHVKYPKDKLVNVN